MVVCSDQSVQQKADLHWPLCGRIVQVLWTVASWVILHSGFVLRRLSGKHDSTLTLWPPDTVKHRVNSTLFQPWTELSLIHLALIHIKSRLDLNNQKGTTNFDGTVCHPLPLNEELYRKVVEDLNDLKIKVLGWSHLITKGCNYYYSLLLINLVIVRCTM